MIRFLQNVLTPLRRHVRLLLLALVLAFVAGAAPAVWLWTQYHKEAALRALERYAFDEAQHHLNLCLKVRPGNAELQLLAAQTARRRDNYEEAERHLSECKRQGGMTSATALEQMMWTAQQGELDGIETTLRARTAADDPDAVLVLEALAKGYANRFWEPNALVCLNILLQRQPNHPHALLMRARAWENRARKGEMAREEDALRDYEKAVELNPSFEAQLGLAGTLYRVGRPWDAMFLYERLRAVQPANPSVLLGLARCRYFLHEVDEAQRLLDELLEKAPADAAALLERGRIALHAGQVEEAEKWLHQAASAAPRYDLEAQRVFCRCLEAEDKTEEARTCLHELREREAKVLQLERLIQRASREPSNVTLRGEIARELMQQGREQDAVGMLFLILQHDRHYAPAQEALADYFERTGQPGRAARHRRAIVSSVRPSTPSR